MRSGAELLVKLIKFKLKKIMDHLYTTFASFVLVHKFSELITQEMVFAKVNYKFSSY